MQFLHSCVLCVTLETQRRCATLKLEYIREYLELAGTLNFSTAAQKLFISQPTLSRHIRSMEEELGFPLVKTSSHGVELTSFGRSALHPFRKMLKEYDTFLERSNNLSRQISGSLRIGLLYYAIDDYFSDFLTLFMKKYPNIQVSCHTYQPQALLNDLMNGKLDVASLLTCPGVGIEGLRCQRIGESRIIAILREDNPLAMASSVSLEALASCPLVVLRQDEYSNRLTRQVLKKNSVFFSDSVYTDNIETVPLTVRMTGGVHITGESCRRQQASGVIYQPISGLHTRFNICIAYVERNPNALLKLLFSELRISTLQ